MGVVKEIMCLVCVCDCYGGGIVEVDVIWRRLTSDMCKYD